MILRFSFGAALFLGAVLLFSSQPADSCGTARPKNIITPVEIASESAIILFDESTKTQHFIRRASFKTDAPDFGFLVPTPTQPTLAEASDEAFTHLAKLTEPKVIKKPSPAGGGCSLACGAPDKQNSADSPSQVKVLEEKRIGAFDTAVLKANDAQALSGWLKKWEYDFSPELLAWVEPYVKQGWIITAFKIAKDNPETKHIASTAVRMSFHTEKPFFPYREPADQRPANQVVSPRLLRVYYLGERRVKGTRSDSDPPWGKVVWANKVSATAREKLLEVLKLPKDTAPANWYLTEFEDHATLRPGDSDVHFEPSDDQTNVERPPSILFVSRPFSDGAMGYAFVACLLVFWGRRRWRVWQGQTS